MSMPGTFDNPTFSGDLNDPADTSPGRQAPGPIPRWTAGIVIGAIIGQALLRRGFKNA